MKWIKRYPLFQNFGKILEKFRRRHEKTSYVLNYAFFTLLHKWVDRGQTHHYEKLQ